MLAICDVNEYRKCVKELGVADVEQLFDVLHSLCNLLVVVPENLRQVSSGELLVRTPPSLSPLPYLSSIYQSLTGSRPRRRFMFFLWLAGNPGQVGHLEFHCIACRLPPSKTHFSLQMRMRKTTKCLVGEKQNTGTCCRCAVRRWMKSQ